MFASDFRIYKWARIVKIRLGLPAQVEETPGTFRSLLAHPGSHVAVRKQSIESGRHGLRVLGRHKQPGGFVNDLLGYSTDSARHHRPTIIGLTNSTSTRISSLSSNRFLGTLPAPPAGHQFGFALEV